MFMLAIKQFCWGYETSHINNVKLHEHFYNYIFIVKFFVSRILQGFKLFVWWTNQSG
jgi:hypothetical protein